MKIGLLLISTGKYHVFVDHLIASARRNLFTNHEVTYFLFTDSTEFTPANDIVSISHEHLPWPYPTLYRYKTFINNSDHLKNMDYLYYCDVDMLFMSPVGDEALGDRVATLHPGYYGTQGTPERNPASLAYLSLDTRNNYFAGGFNGGRRDNFLEMCKVIDTNIDTDMQKDIIAVWHDESHLNHYMYHNPPTLILDPGYCYGESMKLPFTKRLMALDKNHELMRS